MTLRYTDIEIGHEQTKQTKPAEPSAIENLWLIKWKEQWLVPMECCDSLRLLKLKEPSIKVPSDRWVAACPRLETLTVSSAEKLTSLPPRLLESATAFKYLTISNGELQSLLDPIYWHSIYRLTITERSQGIIPSLVFIYMLFWYLNYVCFSSILLNKRQ